MSKGPQVYIAFIYCKCEELFSLLKPLRSIWGFYSASLKSFRNPLPSTAHSAARGPLPVNVCDVLLSQVGLVSQDFRYFR